MEYRATLDLFLSMCKILRSVYRSDLPLSCFSDMDFARVYSTAYAVVRGDSSRLNVGTLLSEFTCNLWLD